MDLELIVKDPIVRGALALFPAYSDAPAAPSYLSGPEAEVAGVLHVSERESGAAVPELEVHNTGNTPVLLLEGETLVGAKQNRTLNVSILIPAQTHVPVPVSCVEAGRWGAPQETARSPRHAPGDLRRLKTMAVNESRGRGLGPRSNQSEVWERISRYEADLGASSSTSALEDVFVGVDSDLDRMVGELTPLPDQRGVVVAIGGTVRGIDFFDKASTLAAYWPGLVQGYAVDALRTPAGAATINDAEAFVGQVRAAKATVEPAAGDGRSLVIGDDAVAGHALEWEGAIVHLAAFATSALQSRPRAGGRIDRSRWSR